MSLQFDFPANLTTEKFIASLSNKTCAQLVSRQSSLKTYYDSFDWRLYKNGITCCQTAWKNGQGIRENSVENCPP
jgi:hypothetical protein